MIFFVDTLEFGADGFTVRPAELKPHLVQPPANIPYEAGNFEHRAIHHYMCSPLNGPLELACTVEGHEGSWVLGELAVKRKNEQYITLAMGASEIYWPLDPRAQNPVMRFDGKLHQITTIHRCGYYTPIAPSPALSARLQRGARLPEEPYELGKFGVLGYTSHEPKGGKASGVVFFSLCVHKVGLGAYETEFGKFKLHITPDRIVLRMYDHGVVILERVVHFITEFIQRKTPHLPQLTQPWVAYHANRGVNFKDDKDFVFMMDGTDRWYPLMMEYTRAVQKHAERYYQQVPTDRYDLHGGVREISEVEREESHKRFQLQEEFEQLGDDDDLLDWVKSHTHKNARIT